MAAARGAKEGPEKEEQCRDAAWQQCQPGKTETNPNEHKDEHQRDDVIPA